MSADLIPALDPAPLPGPPWLFHVLWVVTFLVHLLFVNVVLGGSLLAALAGPRSGGADTRKTLVEVNSWAISLAITFGIAPLLFVQVLYGRFFYTATILVGWAWLGMLGVLTLAYYLNYVAKARLRRGADAAPVLWAVAVGFLVIAVVQVAVNLLQLQPARWTAVAERPFAALADPSFVPRLFHFVLAAVATSGVLLAVIARRRARRGDPGAQRTMATYGIRAALAASALQIVDGLWLLAVLPTEVGRALLEGGVVTLAPLGLGALAGIGLLVLLARGADPVSGGAPLLLPALLATTLLMILTRHQLRDLYLAAARATEQVEVAPQWGVFATFVAVLLLCVGLTVWAVRRAVAEAAGPSGPGRALGH